MLEARHISYAYPHADGPVLEDVSVSIGAGAHVALVGENGRGKSTLARLLAGSLAPTSGDVCAVRGFVSVVLVPMVVELMHRSDELGDALMDRGFGREDV